MTSPSTNHISDNITLHQSHTRWHHHPQITHQITSPSTNHDTSQVRAYTIDHREGIQQILQLVRSISPVADQTGSVRSRETSEENKTEEDHIQVGTHLSNLIIKLNFLPPLEKQLWLWYWDLPNYKIHSFINSLWPDHHCLSHFMFIE